VDSSVPRGSVAPGPRRLEGGAEASPKDVPREAGGVAGQSRGVEREAAEAAERGEVRGGRFVAGFDGEQYALPEAVALLRAVRRRMNQPGDLPPVLVSASDPLNFQGILTPEERIAPATRQQLRVA